MDASLMNLILQRMDIFLLLAVRMLGLFTTAPIWSNRLVPVQMRVALAVAAAVVVAPLFREFPQPESLLSLGLLAARELLVGMAIGFIAALAFAAVQLAGELMDINMGLSMINVLDPMTNTQMPVMGNFLYILSILIFFSINGHHMLLQSILDSYALVPMGKAALSTTLSQSLIVMAARLFVIGFKVAAPVLAALFLTTIALGLLNRAVPQMNVFVIGMPVQLGVGIFMMMVVLPLYVSFLQVLFRGMAGDILTTLRLLKG
jgi:flagellar biosynthesis protein FliR